MALIGAPSLELSRIITVAWAVLEEVDAVAGDEYLQDLRDALEDYDLMPLTNHERVAYKVKLLDALNTAHRAICDYETEPMDPSFEPVLDAIDAAILAVVTRFGAPPSEPDQPLLPDGTVISIPGDWRLREDTGAVT